MVFLGLIKLCHTEDLPAIMCFPIGICAFRVSQSNHSSSSSTIVAPLSGDICSSSCNFFGGSDIELVYAETKVGSVAEDVDGGLIVRETPEPTADGALILCLF